MANVKKAMSIDELCDLLCDLVLKAGQFEEADNLDRVSIKQEKDQYIVTTEFYTNDSLFTITGQIAKSRVHQYFLDEEDEVLNNLLLQKSSLDQKIEERYRKLYASVMRPTEIPNLYIYKAKTDATGEEDSVGSQDDLAKRIESESRCTLRITNDDLVCKDCLSRYEDSQVYGNTSRCKMFDSKPNEILLGGKCRFYAKEESL